MNCRRFLPHFVWVMTFSMLLNISDLKDGKDSLAGLTLGSPLAHHLDALEHELQAILAPLRVGDDFLDVVKHLGIADLLAQLFQEGMDLRENDKHLSAERGLQEQVFVQYALEHQ